MKQTLLRAVLLAAAIAASALPARVAVAAPGLNLGWGFACPTTSLSAADQTDPCDSNGNFYQLIGTAKAPAGLSKVTAEEIVIDLQEGAAQLSPWWHLEDENATTTAGCRGTSLTNAGSLSLTTTLTGISTATCKNYWGSSGSGGQNYVPGFHDQNVADPSGARLQGVFARTASTAGALVTDTQYYVFGANLDTNHTVTDPTDPSVYVCAGCASGVCIVFNSVKFDQPPGTLNGDITVGTQDVRQYATWQAGTGANCQAIPVRRATWGRVKSLYR